MDREPGGPEPISGFTGADLSWSWSLVSFQPSLPNSPQITLG